MTRRGRGNELGMSLFPFLAVLICMMGALIVLLVLVVEQARVYASSDPTARQAPSPAAQAPSAEPTEEQAAAEREAAARREAERELRRQQQMDRDEQIWRRGILETQRQEKTNELANSRLQLGHLEDHIQQLEQQWKQLQGEAQRMRSESPAGDAVDLERLRQAQQELEAQIKARQEEIAQQPKSYAILPYEGPNGTRRRPIYIECSGQGIVLQPVGITLTASDLDGPEGPGNPLDAALRAIREYWRETGVLANSDPYPLMLVRPDGVDAYSAARSSLSAWDDEFGYELVAADKTLAFPPMDAAMVQRVRKAIELAKERQQLLAAAMPKAFGSSRKLGAMRASAKGGFVPVDQDEDLEAQAQRVLAGRDTSGSGASGPSLGAPSVRATAPGGLVGNGAAGNGAAANGAAANGAAGNGAAGTSAGEGAAGNAAGQTASVAAKRGANWALLNYTPGTTGWSRPVRVLCLHDRLVVMREQGGTEPSRTVMIDTRLSDKMDAFAELVRKHVEGWGVAPARGYWKPMLFVEVGPRGEPMYQRLQQLLDNSGFEVRRAKP